MERPYFQFSASQALLAVALLATIPGCVFVGPRSICRVWGDWNTYAHWSLNFERLDHLPYRRPRVETLLWHYGAGPDGPEACDALGADGESCPPSASGTPTPLVIDMAPGEARRPSSSGNAAPIPMRPAPTPPVPNPPTPPLTSDPANELLPARPPVGPAHYVTPRASTASRSNSAASNAFAPPTGAWLFQKPPHVPNSGR